MAWSPGSHGSTTPRRSLRSGILMEALGLAAAPFDWPRWAAEIRAQGQDLLDPALIAIFSAC